MSSKKWVLFVRISITTLILSTIFSHNLFASWKSSALRELKKAEKLKAKKYKYRNIYHKNKRYYKQGSKYLRTGWVSYRIKNFANAYDAAGKAIQKFKLITKKRKFKNAEQDRAWKIIQRAKRIRNQKKIGLSRMAMARIWFARGQDALKKANRFYKQGNYRKAIATGLHATSMFKRIPRNRGY